MKRHAAILILALAGCASQPELLTHHSSPITEFSAFSSAQPEVIAPPKWPTVTLKITFGGFDPVSDYDDEWTNAWHCDVLTSADVTQPLAQWNVVPDVALTNFNGRLGFKIVTNAPWLYVATQYRPRQTLALTTNQ